MGLDIRLPIGLLFILLGGVLTVFGLLSDASLYTRSLGHNINLSWGLPLLLFGLGMAWYGRRGTSTSRPAEDTPGGRATEAREHRTGLEEEGDGHGRPRGH